MSAGSSISRKRRAGTLLALLGGLALFGVSGCVVDQYPDDLAFPERTDPLVLQPPQAQPTGFDTPGQYTGRQVELFALAEAGKGGKLVDPLDGEKGVKPDDRQKLTEALVKMFGTPAHPRLAAPDANVPGTVSMFDGLRKALQLDEATLETGSKLYRRHCLHCHGVAGDGRGPTGPWVNPHPRDFRQGQYKFTSSKQGAQSRKPRRDDLLRVLRNGIEGTSMPSFGLLPEQELQALASTVIHLSLRGQAEFGTIAALTGAEALTEDEELNELVLPSTGKVEKELTIRTVVYANQWQEADKNLISAEDDKYPYEGASREAMHKSITEGHRLFKTSGCLDCHYDYGRKDTFRYDAWGTVVRPNNLTVGLYRGGRRPIDLYWRVHSGIGPVGMPSAPDQLRDEKKLWDLVNFVQALPYPHMLPDKVREEIYPPGQASAARGGH